MTRDPTTQDVLTIAEENIFASERKERGKKKGKHDDGTNDIRSDGVSAANHYRIRFLYKCKCNYSFIM